MTHRLIQVTVLVLACHGIALTGQATPGAANTPNATKEQGSIALLAKSVSDLNFVAAWRGCQEYASRRQYQCLLLGPEGSASPRAQLQALDAAVTTHDIDALAVSVTHSALLAHRLKSLSVPVFTFDSPLSAPYQGLSLAYVGMDNRQMGRELGYLARQLHPKGGTLCLMSAENDTNLNLRMAGVREVLNRGWTELARCPWDSGDSVNRALRQLQTTLTQLQPDVFIAVGHWPVLEPHRLQAMLTALETNGASHHTSLLFATGHLSEAQLSLLNEGLVDGYVAVDFYQIGRAVAQQMIAYLAGENPAAPTPVPSRTYTRDRP
ncbi:MAG: substrate-binding domain-containing protein [Pseudomonadota bacterium]|nr:hypothetical protein [Pseudomonadales bacterium]MDY6919073.1 substrate-binding domain-containing protein [Pseudomonadota bacterium]